MGSCNFSQDVINNIDGSQTTDNALGIVNCATQTTENYKSYRPYFVVNKQFLTIGGKTESSDEGFKQFDGDCCYQITSNTADASSCSDISFTDASGVSIKLDTATDPSIPRSGRYTIQNTDSQYDNSLVNICGINKTDSTGSENGAAENGAAENGAAENGAVSAAASSANNEIQSNEAKIQEDAKMEGGIKGLVLLVISAILSTLLYVVFLLGPFLFWTKFAPNTIIKGENNCNAGRTILDRFFSYDETKVPYAWEKYANCRPPRQPSASVDKCMDENQFKLKYSTTNQDLWSHVESLIRGYPYNLIKPNREKILENYKGLPLLGATLFLCSIIFGILFFPNYQNYTVNDNIIAGKIIEILVGFIVVLAIMGLITNFLIKLNSTNWKLGVSVLSGVLIALGLIIKNFVIQENDKIGKLGTTINSAVFTVATFIGMASIVKLKNIDNNDYNFPHALAKGLYYIRKSFVTGYKSSVKNSNKRVNNILKFIGSLPIPDWIFVMGGSFIIPLVLLIILFTTMIVGSWNGILGFFDYTETFNKVKTFTDSKLNDNSSNNNNSTGGPDIRGPIAFFLMIGLIPVIFGVIFGLFNTVFKLFTFIFMPLLYPKIFVNVITCNIKALTFLFGLGLLATMWKLHNHDKVDFVPVEALAWMTVTFCVVTFYNIFVK
jgi:hypothetical protein